MGTEDIIKSDDNTTLANARSEEPKAFLLEEKPIYQRGDKERVIISGKVRKVVIRNIYSRKLEDLTFNDLEMIGYLNPNVFVKEWMEDHKSFDKDKDVWVVVYVAYKELEKEVKK